MIKNTMRYPTTEEAERLILLAEECSEVVQMVSKIIRFGWDDVYNDLPPNRRRLMLEVVDVEAIISLMCIAGDFGEDLKDSDDFITNKFDRLLHFTRNQKKVIESILARTSDGNDS